MRRTTPDHRSNTLTQTSLPVSQSLDKITELIRTPDWSKTRINHGIHAYR